MDEVLKAVVKRQMDRVELAVKEVLPGPWHSMEFDGDKLPYFIWFRVRDKRTENYFPILTSGDYTPEEIAGWPDDRLLEFVRALAQGH